MASLSASRVSKVYVKMVSPVQYIEWGHDSRHWDNVTYNVHCQCGYHCASWSVISTVSVTTAVSTEVVFPIQSVWPPLYLLKFGSSEWWSIEVQPHWRKWYGDWIIIEEVHISLLKMLFSLKKVENARICAKSDIWYTCNKYTIERNLKWNIPNLGDRFVGNVDEGVFKWIMLKWQIIELFVDLRTSLHTNRPLL